MRNRDLLTTIFFCVQFSLPAQVTNLSNASHDRDVKFKISGNPKSSHYHTPLLLEIQNNSTKTKTIQIDPGQIMEAEDEAFQDFVVTQRESISLAPNESKVKPLHAMCMERFDMAPNASTFYTYGPKADTSLAALCEKIFNDQLFNIESQTAIWALQGDISIENIVGFDTTLVNDLICFVANARGEKPPTPPSEDDYKRNYYSTNYTFKVKMGGELSYSLFHKSEVIIAMFDKNDIAVRELFKNEACPPGIHKMKFSFDATEYKDELYFVRLIENGEIMLELEVKTPKPPNRG